MVDFFMLAGLSWLIPLFPLLGFVILALAGRMIKGRTAGVLASIMVFLSFLFAGALYLFSRHAAVPAVTITCAGWINTASLSLPFEFLIDPLSITMMLIVTGVGLLIHVYSIGYMAHDERFASFFSQMNLFTFFMLLLVMGANYAVLFIGWEGVGLCSYLLIGFWFRNNEYNLAARKAFVMNRIGDLGFLLGMVLLFFNFGSLSFGEVFNQAAYISSGDHILTVITLLFFIGAIGKSAQIPLYTWLPDAMAGPTPVSALIHAATMVTAGVYLIARSSQLFVLAPLTMAIIAATGLATAVFAASISLLQNDIKKVLAYSTVSQLGYMFLALGIGAFSSAVFHLTTHAFFKALLFLAAGSVIHALHGEQDIRRMGGLKKALPLTYWTFLAATLAISDIPPFSGFFSKDEILAGAFGYNPWLYAIALFGALLTCFYMFRLFFLVFHGEYRGVGASAQQLRESPRVMTIPLIILAILSFAGGILNIPQLLGGNEGLSVFLWPSVGTIEMSEPTHLFHRTELLLIGISVLLLLFIIFAARRYYLTKGLIPAPDGQEQPFFKKLLSRKYYVDELYHMLFVRPYEWLSVFFYEKVEKGLVNPFINTVGLMTLEFGNRVRKLQSGNISLYLFAMLGGLLVFLLLNLLLP